MLAIDRRLRILEQVADAQSIHVGELARRFDVSEMTIRRDIQRLERDGFLRRTYGGATAHLTRSLDRGLNARSFQHSREKHLIGIAAARLAADADPIFIGIGTTCEQFARYLASQRERTVVTNYLPIASLLGTRPVHTIVTGGTVRRDELSCIGPNTTETLARYRFELAVIGAAGVSAEAGITELRDDEAEVNRLALAHAQRVVVLADGSKVGEVAMAVVAPSERIDLLVTDDSAPAPELERLRRLGIAIHVAATRMPAPGPVAPPEEPGLLTAAGRA